VAFVALTVAPTLGDRPARAQPSQDSQPAGSARRPPDLPGELAKQVADAEQVMDEVLAQTRTVDAQQVSVMLEAARQIIAVRETNQGSSWWQTINARQRLTDLQRFVALSPDQRRILAEAETLEREVQRLYGEREYEQAITPAVKSRDLRLQILGADHPLYATCLANLAILYGAMGRYQDAEPLYRQSLEIRKRVLGDQHPAYNELLGNLASLYSSIGRYDQAESLLLHVLEARENVVGKDDPSYTQSLNNLGVVYQSMGRYDRSEAIFKSAAETFKRTLGEEHHNYVSALLNLASSYRESGRYLEAEPLQRQVAVTWKKTLGEAHPDYGRSLNGLATLYHVMGRYSEAEPLYRQALEIRRAALGDAHPDYAETLHNLGLLNLQMGQYAVAERFYRQVAEIRRKVGGEEDPLYAQSLANLALVYQSTDRKEQAELLLRQVIDIEKKVLGEEHPSYATTLMNLATLYDEMGRGQQGEPLARLAVEICRKSLGEEHPTCAMSLAILANLYRSIGRHEQAEPLFRQALEIQKRVVGEEHPDYTRTAIGLAWVLATRQAAVSELSLRRSEASALLLASAELQWKHMTRNFTSLTAQQKRQLLSSSQYVQSEMLWILVGQGLGVQASRGLRGALLTKQLLFEAARQESSALVAVVSAAPPAWRALWQEREQLRREYATLALRARADAGRPDSTPRDMVRFRELTERIEQVEQDLRRGNLAYANAARLQQAGVEDVTRAVRPDEALIEYVRYESSGYGAFVLRGTGDVVAIDLGAAAAIDAAVEAFREAVRTSIDEFGAVQPSPARLRRSEDAIAQASSALRALVWAPLEQALSGARRVYVAPDGALSLIPFEALARAETAGGWKYLVEERELVYLSTGRDLARLALSARSSAAGASTAVLIGNPAFSATPPQMAAAVAGPQPTRIARAGGASASSTLGTVTAGAARHDVPRTWQQVPLLEQLVAQARQQLTRLGWTVRTLTNTQAVEETVLDVQAPRLLQFATHGYILDKPATDPEGWDNPLLRSMLLLAGANTWERERAVFYRVNGKMLTEAQARAAGLSAEQLATSRVELADGILTAYEVTGMNLQGTELVNLTACETGLGEVTPDGVVGLRQAFLLAGARALTMSMWEVPASETTTQMGDFYERWLGGTAARRATTTRYGAFRGAQLAALARARQTSGGGHPFYWAGTVYVGDPGDLPAVRP
jgi:tetratricopeptide (TPR) repeat protein/CHAT domain-containing protein